MLPRWYFNLASAFSLEAKYKKKNYTYTQYSILFGLVLFMCVCVKIWTSFLSPSWQENIQHSHANKSLINIWISFKYFKKFKSIYIWRNGGFFSFYCFFFLPATAIEWFNRITRKKKKKDGWMRKSKQNNHNQ